ncbi:MAG: hypothetical protein JSW04_09185 [Desulfobacterales bacterium]|nr:MAG: hypothetical protein JSW04_09185 [Desulfobacterales bacterium]
MQNMKIMITGGRGRPGHDRRGVHLPCYQSLIVAYYGCVIECLANERLTQVTYQGHNPQSNLGMNRFGAM